MKLNNSGSDAIIKIIKECPVFQGFSASEVKKLISISHIRNYSEGEKIFSQGTLGICFYIITGGSAEIVFDNNGESVKLKDLITGDFFSETHLFADTYHNVSCISREASQILVITRPDLEHLIKTNPRFANKLLLRFLEHLALENEKLYKDYLSITVKSPRLQ